MGRKKIKGKPNFTLFDENNGNTPPPEQPLASRHVRFNASSSNGTHSNGKLGGQSGMHKSPSTNTLNRLDRDSYVLWKRPFWTVFYCVCEIVCLVRDFLKSLLHLQRLIPCIAIVSGLVYLYLSPGQHKEIMHRFEKPVLWSLYWMWLGVLSSIGLGTGLHTFVLYLGPHIAHVTLAAFECNSIDFPEPPYPTEITCPTNKPLIATAAISLWDIVSKVRLESLMWGVGTAFGELPPYFMARAARISGQEIDDEEYQEYRAYVDGINPTNEMGIFTKWKIRMEKFMEEVIKKIGFPGILLFASVPNPFFDLAGITCGHFLIPFWTFFGATVIGKAVVKMHFQMLCVVLAFSEHHIEDLVNRLKFLPHIGEYVQAPLKEFLRAQKIRLHRRPEDPVPDQANSMVGMLMNSIVICMVMVFLLWKRTDTFTLQIFYQQILQIKMKRSGFYNKSSKILEFHHPAEMSQIIDLGIPEKPMNLSQLLKCCEEVLRLGVKTGHPRFFNQISCGLDLVSMAGEWLTATCNTNMFTYEISPVFILMEKEIIRRMIQLIGWPTGEGDAIFSPGGALANLYAMNAARHHHFPRVKPLGMTSVPTLCTFTSEDSHYSIKSAAAALGIGTDNCFIIATDKIGRMIPEALEQKIIKCKSEGLYPFFVCATAGTTVYGAWDPLPQISEICQRHKVWMHVDAAWGGGLLLSPEHRHKLVGIERAQSVTWNPHKLMGALLQCSACFIRHEGLLFQTNQQSADYLFNKTSLMIALMTLETRLCSVEGTTTFLNWNARLSQTSESTHAINTVLHTEDKNTEGYEMVIEQPEYLNVCFWYVPPSLRQLDPKERLPD
uniref:Uncharacterized protein n=1 Tax=Ditylenchus dipsaci TaxID=166011 RepID=A0A915EBV0_9BILA